MAFKRSGSGGDVPANPVELFRSLSKREYPTEMPHQGAILKAYVDQAVNKSDVAMQLPTGSGKTLVGLLVAEWRRRKFDQRVLYLCPTRQLVNQTALQADEKYGLDVVSFTGKKASYSPEDVARYKTGNLVAVATYSSLFNVNPFFDDADTIIIDDAHAAENYIASMWTLEIDPKEQKHHAVHVAVSNLLKSKITKLDYARLTGRWSEASDSNWVDKLPTPILMEIKDDLTALLETHTKGTDLAFSWSLIRDHLHACHLYLSSRSILIRPLIPPVWSHPAFERATHRIYMSATLGEGGDLERLTGRENIFRLPIPDGFALQGVGRRFFMFPGMSLEPPKCESLRIKLMEKAGRSVVLAPSQAVCDVISSDITKKLGYPIYSANDIEDSKENFIAEEAAVAVLAGRYDGIDFPKDECRLLCVDGLPRAMNIQESFIQSKMGAAILFNERIQTRVLQAIGRCTRALQDSSAVYITGFELQDYLSDKSRWKYFYPELQAELRFGVDQSIGVKARDFEENFDIFFENGKDWAECNQQIFSDAKKAVRSEFPAMEQLNAAVKSEIRYQKSMWKEDFIEAYGEAQSVLGHLTSPDLKGYRALWHYLAGSAAYLAALNGNSAMDHAAREQFRASKKATSTLPWLVKLSQFAPDADLSGSTDVDLVEQVERMEEFLLSLGTTHDGSYVKFEKAIIQGLSEASDFEQAHRDLGLLLGFDAGKEESEGSPDPWWIGRSMCFVFEDHAGALATSELSTEKARQTAGHPNWMKQNLQLTSDLEVLPILVSPVRIAKKGAKPHLGSFILWPLEDFRAWSLDALGVVRDLRKSLSGPGDMVWRAEASVMLESRNLSMRTIRAMLSGNLASEMMK